MSSVKGILLTCDRCGNTRFLKFLTKVDMDGGFSPSYDKYEDEPKEWMYETQLGHLCPTCAEEFQLWVNDFMDGKVAPAWKKSLNPNSRYAIKEETNKCDAEIN